MKKKKQNTRYFWLGMAVVCSAMIVVALLFYLSSRENSFTFQEKSWINENVDKIISVNVEGNLPIFSGDGEGVFYDYLKDMEKDTGLTFNITVNGSAEYNFLNKNELSSEDLVFYTDHYVLVSTLNDPVSNLSQTKGQVIGVLDGDKEYVSNYLSSYGLEFQGFKDIEELNNQMDNSIIYAIVPMYKYMNDIVYKKYNIVYHIEGLHSHYVLNKKDNSSTLSTVFTKFFNIWDDEIYTSINKHFLSLYYNAYSLSDMEKNSIIGDDLIIGYIDNMPFEGKVNGTFSGVTSEYLDLFGKMTGATYKYIKYSDTKEFIDALNNKKIDMAMNYYNISNNNYENSVGLGNINYVIVTHQDNVIPVDNLTSIKDDSVKMLGSTKLYNFMRENNLNITVYGSYKELFENLDNDDILILEKTTYDYYKSNKLADYVIKFIGDASANNTFILNKDNAVLNKMLNFYITTLGPKTVDNMAVRDTLRDANDSIIVKFIFNNITYIILICVALGFFLNKLNKKVKVTKKIKKEDKMMYLDVMTNLKNRNYLNDNLNYWESNKIYPQAVVVVDLNSISVINDTKGHEEGDKQIKSAASILIKTQRENSEIIRTDGNEFLIYLVGYEEKQIITYINKLLKEFKNLPYEYGASIGYSLINTESTTIDDAINEALIMMRKNKGE